jgi:hypothetical protein
MEIVGSKRLGDEFKPSQFRRLDLCTRTCFIAEVIPKTVHQVKGLRLRYSEGE